ncbi:hypothetical protein SAMN05421837_11890 [Amycolatopsis pretoriensis]|uniref:Uncharacterized protein n=1 Tax=Amycolatopsis pretoriensis TaxID=218821 RepID=A0A1H5RIJ4_9PSEU|nr:hypothetical protein [Amycolatopsis pretoriensis]SEF38139.1 hypothetical protein SAMN05421837_11890 [Amycolatopsis pretoriensis]
MTDPHRPAIVGTYLDDPALQLVIDPADVGADAETVIGDLLTRDPPDAAIIVRGAVLLSAADAGTAAECLATSMTWLYG